MGPLGSYLVDWFLPSTFHVGGSPPEMEMFNFHFALRAGPEGEGDPPPEMEMFNFHFALWAGPGGEGVGGISKRTLQNA